ncbi:MAG: hypothetical protein WC838_02610 [Candidatus Margulisiibacteriota bacterium]|jgi:hypothetical protein
MLDRIEFNPAYQEVQPYYTETADWQNNHIITRISEEKRAEEKKRRDNIDQVICLVKSLIRGIRCGTISQSAASRAMIIIMGIISATGISGSSVVKNVLLDLRKVIQLYFRNFSLPSAGRMVNSFSSVNTII